jgi:Fe2+ transport system protein FeoA
MPLRRIKSGKAIIRSLPKDYRRQLLNLGLIPGVEIEIIQNVRRMPIVLKVHNSTLAISRYIGREIMCDII